MAVFKRWPAGGTRTALSHALIAKPISKKMADAIIFSALVAKYTFAGFV